MKKLPVILAVLITISGPATTKQGATVWAAESSSPSPNIHGETIEHTSARSGYTVEEIAKYFPPIEEWAKYGIRPAPNKMAESFAADRFKAPPKPYVHPRVYFNAEDLPEIRRRLKETQIGHVQMGSIRGRLLQFSPDQKDWESVPVKPTEADYRRYAERGLLIEGRAGYRGPWVGGWVNELTAGRVPPGLDGKWTLPVDKNHRQYFMHLLPYEAFRCLIDQDEAGGKRLAAALTTLAENIAKEMPKWTATDNWQSIYQLLSSGSLALAYDWGYPWMPGRTHARYLG